MRLDGRIWLIGGTSESVDLAKAIASENRPCTITVTTKAAVNLYPENSWLKIRVGILTNDLIEDFLKEEKIIAIVDASHPYAVEISQLSIAISQQQNIPYLRYERPLGEGTKENVIEVESIEKLVRENYLLGKRVLLTIGSKALPLFKPLQNRCTLFTRILPTINALDIALQSGFASDRIIAWRSLVNFEVEKALWQHWQLDLVVTKASGKAGGEHLKRQVAKELGVSLIVISRPPIDYPLQTADLAFVLNFVRKNSQNLNKKVIK